MARDCNDAIDAYNALLEEAEAAVDLHNYLVVHAHDRPGSYLRARAYLAG